MDFIRQIEKKEPEINNEYSKNFVPAASMILLAREATYQFDFESDRLSSG